MLGTTISHYKVIEKIGQGEMLWPFFYAGFSLKLPSELAFPLVQELQDFHSNR